MVCSIIAANNEFFFYGKERFTKEHEFFKQILSREPYCRVVDALALPTWDILVARFNGANTAIDAAVEQSTTALDLAVQCSSNN